MPLVPIDDMRGRIGGGLPPPQAAPVGGDPGWLDLFEASFRTENTVGSALSSETTGAGFGYEPRDPDLDVWGEIKGTDMEPHFERFVDVRTRPQLEALRVQIGRETKDRELIAAGGFAGIATSVTAGLLDLPTLMPGAALIRSGKVGYSLARSAAAVGVAAGLDATVSEAALQASQQTRSLRDSAINIGGSILLGGALGAGAAKALSKMEWRALSRKLEADMVVPDGLDPADEMAVAFGRVMDGASAGAAAVRRYSADDLAIDPGVLGLAGKQAQATAFLNPVLRLATSTSAVARRLGSELFENPVYLKMHAQGESLGPAVETARKAYQAGLGESLQMLEKSYSAMRKAGGENITLAEFSARVGQAMRRNDMDAAGNEGITAAARAYREKVFEPLKNAAIEVGLLPPDVNTSDAASYFSRVYNREKLTAQEPQFREAARPFIRSSVQRQVKADRRRIGKLVDRLYREVDDIEMAKLRREELARSEGPDVEVSEEDVLSAMNLVREGKPKQPQRFADYIVKMGGIKDWRGEVRAVVGPRGRVGLVNNQRGIPLDDAILRAWEDGWFPDATERPGFREFLDLLDGDVRGWRPVVHPDNQELQEAVDVFDDMVRLLDQLGVDLKAKTMPRNLKGTPEFREFRKNLKTLLDAKADERATRLRQKAATLEVEARDVDDAFVSDADLDDFVEDILTDVVAKITGREAGDQPGGITIKARGPLKERTLHIPDEVLEPWLISDVREVAARHTRVMGAEVELARRFGTVDMEDQLLELKEDYSRLRSAIDGDGALTPQQKEKARQKLADRERKDRTDILGGRDLLRGTYWSGGRLENATWQNIAATAKLYQYTTKMGGAVITSIADAARHVMVHGMGRVMGTGLPALIASVGKGEASGYAQATRQLKMAGQVWENMLHTRLATFAEITDPYQTQSPFQRFIANSAAMFSKLNLLGAWTDFNKAFAGVLTTDRIVDNLMAGFGKVDAGEQRYLAYLGIDHGMGDRIAEQLRTAGARKVDGVWVANTERWTDGAAKRAFFGAINKDVDSIIVSRGVGDVPLMANTPVGSVMLQFKSFALATNQRALIRGLQEDQQNFLLGLTTMVTLGMASYAIYSLASGRDLSDNPGKWLAEGIERSGILAVAFEVNNTAAKVGAPDIYWMLQSAFPNADQKEPASRYASRGVAGSLLGPSFGTLVDTGVAGRAFATGEWSQSDVNALRRLVPYNNLFYIRRPIDALTDIEGP